jgi:hypothetical protein
MLSDLGPVGRRSMWKQLVFLKNSDPTLLPTPDHVRAQALPNSAFAESG